MYNSTIKRNNLSILKNTFCRVISICLFSICTIYAKDDVVYKKPNTFDWFLNIPDDYSVMYDKATNSDNLDTWALITASTAIFLYYDDEIIKESKRVGKKLSIAPDSGMKPLITLGPYPIIQIPKTGSSTLYWIGDGAVHIGIMAGFLAYGAYYDDAKTLSVGAQLLEGLCDVAIATQVLKHITGHESPRQASVKGGKWRWLPNQADYADNVEKYDAFPSGHLATMTMTVTILSENYPDNPYIKPIGYSAMGLLAFQMMNNGVHWASDYPLAIGIGYTFGKIISARARGERSIISKNIKFSPVITANSGYGASAEYKF